MGSVTVIYPVPSKSYVMPDDSICVVGSLGGGADKGQLALVLGTEAPDWTDPANYTEVTDTNFIVEVPYGGTADPAPDDDDYKLVFRPVTAEVPGAEHEILLTRQPDNDSATVSAKDCLWYAFVTNDGIAGPGGFDDPVGDYTPAGPIQIPWNAGDAEFTATQAEEWKHDPNDATKANPDGRTGIPPRGLEVAGYQNAIYNSNVIDTITTHLCKLIGLWRSPTGSMDPFPYKQFDIGANSTISVPDDAKQEGKLFLGMHDGHEWNNNSGETEVDITWTAESCEETLAMLRRAGLLKNWDRRD